MTSADIKKAKYVHVLGIGGIGVSAIARLLALEGREVSGQDTADSPVITELTKAGIKVFLGQKLSFIPKNTDLVVYSNAIPKMQPVFMTKVKKLGIPILSYPEALGQISKDKYTIAVSGTHGKTTTTAMIGHILSEAGLDPTIIVGSLLKDKQSNFVAGKSKYLVVEADEYNRQFLHLSPTVLVITNIGLDHLDYYSNLADIKSAFSELAKKVPRMGYFVINVADKDAHEVVRSEKAKVIDYREFNHTQLRLPAPGEHNRANAAAASAVAHVLGIPKKSVLKAFKSFAGTWRRFDFKGKTKSGATVYDDYAHNPDKVRAALLGYREAYPNQRLVVVFQPHLYSRTKTLLEGFASAFDEADEVIIAPIFAAREKRDKTISERVLSERIVVHLKSEGKKKPKVSHFASVSAIEKILRSKLTKKDVLITMGAGDIYLLADRLCISK